MQLSDSELVHLGQLGNTDAFAELVQRWSARVLAVCHTRVRRRDVAEELAQEAFLRGFQHLGTIERPDRFGAWVSSIAGRVCLDWLKAKQTSQISFSEFSEQHSVDRMLATVPGTSEEIERHDEVRHLMHQVESLDERHREVMMLYYYEDLSYQELADHLGISKATVNARLTQARAILRRRLRSTEVHESTVALNAEDKSS